MSYQDPRTGKWIAERRIKGSKTRVRFLSKAEADKWEAYVDATGHAPMDGSAAALKHSLGVIAKAARAQREGWKGSHDVSLDQRLEGVLHFFGPHNPVESITKVKLYDFVTKLEGRKGRYEAKLSGKTINRYLAVVSALIDHARECGWTTHTVNIPWQEEAEGRIEFLTKEEEAAVAARLKPDEAKVLRLLILTGLRASEFFEHCDVDTTDNRCAWLRLRGMDTKGGKGRSVPLHDFELARWLKAAKADGTLPTHDEFYKSFKEACAACGLSTKLNVHSLRHTFGTRAAKATKPALVQALMGHGSYKTTQKYVHLTDDDLMAATAAL